MTQSTTEYYTSRYKAGHYAATTFQPVITYWMYEALVISDAVPVQTESAAHLSLEGEYLIITREQIISVKTRIFGFACGVLARVA